MREAGYSRKMCLRELILREGLPHDPDHRSGAGLGADTEPSLPQICEGGEKDERDSRGAEGERGLVFFAIFEPFGGCFPWFLTPRAGVHTHHTHHTAMTATITLKVDAKEKKRWQREASRAKKSLNAYVLGKVAGADVSRKGRVDYDKLTECFAGRFEKEELWRIIPGRE